MSDVCSCCCGSVVQLISSAIDKVFEEASSDKDLQYIDFSDYRAVRVLQALRVV